MPFNGLQIRLYTTNYYLAFLTNVSNRNLSATMAMNSEFVGLDLLILTEYPNTWVIASLLPRFHATSIAWRIALSTRDAVV